MRKLALKKETVAELTAGDLDAVVGALAGVTAHTQCICSGIASCYTYRCPTLDCVASLNGC